MDWLKDHGYIASWLSPLIALLGMVIKNMRAGTTDTQWSMVMIYVAFLTCLAAVFTPVIDPMARFFAGFATAAMAFFIANHAYEEAQHHWKSKNPS